MELKLNIYKNQREVEKTYTANTYDIMFGTIEDFMNMLDLEAFMGNGGTASLMEATSKLMSGGLDVIKPLLKDIFPELTDAELRRTKAKELLGVLAGLTGFSLDELKSLYNTGKKALEGERTS